MPREIYNEGRVVGYSAYEIYVKHHLSEDPTGPIASEREWLASSIAMGSSMLAKIPVMELTDEDSHGYIDIPLPSNSVLAAANTIIASFFDGEAEWSDVTCTGTSSPTGGAWATRVTDYGQAISNTSSSYPGATVSADQHNNVPRKTLEDWTQAQKDKLRSYMKIVDGIVIQPGKWVNAPNNPPTKDLKPTLAGVAYPTIRLHIKGSIKANTQPYILFTGFTIQSVLTGTVGADGSTDTPSPQNGDFLGPGIFPWANKIVFSVPTSYIVYFASGAYKRKINPDNPVGLTGDTKHIRVSDTPVIDMKSGSADGNLDEPVLENYYNTAQATDIKFYENTTSANSLAEKKKSRIPDTVSDFTTLGDGVSVLTVYSKKAIYPPALYGTFVDSTGGEFLHPIDVVAPGSVKMFFNDDGSSMQDYQDTFEGVTSINKTTDGELEVLDPDPNATPGTKVKVAGLEIRDVDITLSSGYDAQTETSVPRRADQKSASGNVTIAGSNDPQKVIFQTGKRKAVALSLDNDENPEESSFDGVQTTISEIPSTGITLDDKNSNDFITWAALLAALANDQGVDILAERLRSIKNHIIENNPASGTKNGPYIEFGPNGTGNDAPIRLYICKNEPETSGVPIGSIGIGWGFAPENS